MDRDLGTLIQSDVLIVGGGIAGLFAAIKAKGKDPSLDVVLVDKCHAGAAGSTAHAAGVFPNWQPGDEYEDFMREIIEDNSEYLMDQDYAKVTVPEGYDRFRDLLEFGVEFQRDVKGQVIRVPAIGTKFGKCAPYHGGIHMPMKLRTEAVRRGARMFDMIFAVDLLMQDGRCVGAGGFDLLTGQFYAFGAKAVVLAGGSLAFARPITGHSGTTGDAGAMAFRAGAQLRNMEQFGGLTTGPAAIRTPGLHVIFGSGGILVNNKGERFMEEYSPVLLEESRRYVTARAIMQEWREGRGPCWLDCTHLPPEKIASIKTSLPRFAIGLRDLGLDLAVDKIEWVPYAPGLMHHGGVRLNNADGDVGVPGLWVVGAAGDYCGGADQSAVVALPGSSVQGARAGERAAEYAAGVEMPKTDMSQIWQLNEATYEPLKTGHRSARSVTAANHHLSEVMVRYVNIIKDESMLEQAIEEVAKLKDELGDLTADDLHELAKLNEHRNMVQLSEICARSALLRTESRMAHFRIDYPNRDDKNWLKWMVAKLVNGKVKVWAEDIPIAKWKYRPTRA